MLIPLMTMAAMEPRANIVLTSQENGVESQQEFLCDGKIHGYIRLPKRMVGRHTLESQWTMPNGKVSADSRNEIDFPAPGRSTAYIWFTFPPRPGPLSGPDPETDSLRRNYPGVWKVSVRWDDQPLLQSSFTVTCQ
jgi:hypothetical protein